MPKAIWNGKVIAESTIYETVEGNVYFPHNAANQQYLRPSTTTSECGWKGTASYYTLDVDGVRNEDAAWYYADPKPAAKNISGYIAFWKGVTVERD